MYVLTGLLTIFYNFCIFNMECLTREAPNAEDNIAGMLRSARNHENGSSAAAPSEEHLRRLLDHLRNQN